jgi:hypothetical protein
MKNPEISIGHAASSLTNIRRSSARPTVSIPKDMRVHLICSENMAKSKRLTESPCRCEYWANSDLSDTPERLSAALSDVGLNIFENNIAQRNAGPGTGAGVTRPNYVGGCDPVITGSAVSKSASGSTRPATPRRRHLHSATNRKFPRSCGHRELITSIFPPSGRQPLRNASTWNSVQSSSTSSTAFSSRLQENSWADRVLVL